MNATDYIPLKPDVFHILLALLDGPRHGYALMTEIAESTDGEIRLLPGALYRRLQRLLHDGLITERGPQSPESDSRRRVFEVSSFGRAVAEAEAARLARLVEAARIRDLIKGAEARS